MSVAFAKKPAFPETYGARQEAYPVGMLFLLPESMDTCKILLLDRGLVFHHIFAEWR